MPKISVIIPVYKVEDYIRECLDSIKNQTFADFEVLLIDDGSPDSSGAICDEYAAADARFKVFHKPNGGVSSARNMGLDNAKGEWIAFLDPDDYIRTIDMYKEIMEQIVDEDYDLICFGHVNSSGDETFPFSPYNVEYKKLYRYDILKEFFDFFNVWTNFFKREKIGDLRFADIKISEDSLFVRSYLLNENVTSVLEINKLYVFYRTNENSAMNSSHTSLMDDFAHTVFKTQKQIEENNLDVDKLSVRKLIVEYYFLGLRMHSQHKDEKELAKIAKECAPKFEIHKNLTWDIIFEHKKPYISYLLVKLKLYKLAGVYIKRKGLIR